MGAEGLPKMPFHPAKDVRWAFGAEPILLPTA